MVKAATDETDAEGYPVMYVRGEFNNWGYSNATRMSREGSTYTITLPSLNGRFKVGGSAWVCNLGGDAAGINISSPTALVCIQNGQNDTASNLSVVRI